MFTNWLTGTTTNSSGSGTASSGSVGGTTRKTTQRLENNNTVLAPAPSVAASLLMPAAASANTPPDVVLEVGHSGTTATMRFMAHSLVLSMHSGYLRSAIRLDDQQQQQANGNSSSTGGGRNAELVLYLSNVTVEQFAPLLTYMYTGYLDVNVENIFGVLLATHVLHMPRALEICRAFLARAQTEGYLTSSTMAASLPQMNFPANSGGSGAGASAAVALQPKCAVSGAGKIIRPIPSKATLPNFGFLPLPIPSTTTPTPQPAAINYAATAMETDEIDVEQHSKSPLSATTVAVTLEADEDEEVFIDSSSTDTDVDADISVASSPRSVSVMTVATEAPPPPTPLPTSALASSSHSSSSSSELDHYKTKNNNSNNNSVLERQSGGGASGISKAAAKRRSAARHKPSGTRRNCNGSGLQVARAPIPAAQLDAIDGGGGSAADSGGGSKVIIDVASCDGPVRFRRILNTAYGHKPTSGATGGGGGEQRTQQSVSLSFHQQMARTISQQRQQQQHAEESENSEGSSSTGGGGGATPAAERKLHATTNGGKHELYICVYCRHTFKSQYCYQKHAKRHLNPLSLGCASARDADEPPRSADVTATVVGHGGALSCSSSSCMTDCSSSTAAAAAAGGSMRREVRPLDMNVQYYPCKTCGSKFPSYYFVHKHRKLCHADEDNTAVPGNGTAGEREDGEEAVGSGEHDAAPSGNDGGSDKR